MLLWKSTLWPPAAWNFWPAPSAGPVAWGLIFVAVVLGGLGAMFLISVAVGAGAGDPWRRKKRVAVPPDAFGAGSRQPFTWYFQRQSVVPVTSVAEICDWLDRCQYRSDQALFRQADVWQHPVDFEQHGRGDCEDHALWVWRKLVDLGLAAELVVGDAYRAARARQRHAWVVFTQSGRVYLFETVAKTRAEMIQPLARVKRKYRPALSVDATGQTYRYGGWR